MPDGLPAIPPDTTAGLLSFGLPRPSFAFLFRHTGLSRDGLGLLHAHFQPGRFEQGPPRPVYEERDGDLFVTQRPGWVWRDVGTPFSYPWDYVSHPLTVDAAYTATFERDERSAALS